MDYSLQQHSDPSEWMYSQHDISLTTTTQEPLSEPVPFEDFQFSFGLDPGFSAPIPFDMPTDPPSLNDSSHLLSMDYQHDMDQQQDANLPLADNNPLLDENDQKAFSQFLDAFFVDKDGQISNAEQMASEFSTMYDAQPPPLLLSDTYHHSPPAPPSRIAGMDPYQVATSMFLPKPKPARQEQDEDDEHRRSSILQSLDQQKQLHQRLNRAASAQHFATKETFSPYQQDPIGPSAIFLQQSNQVSAPFITKHPSTASQRYHPQQHAPYPPPERHYHRPSTASSTSSSSSRQSPDQDQDSPHHSSARSSSTSTRRNKSHKELLTEEEKRNNHIASEQKRRSTIRNGFKDLTDIVPTLKNINNSKSTVLFKAVDYIKYLEKRNNHLRDKMKSLEVRIKVEGRVSDMLMHTSPSATLQPITVPSHPSQQPTNTGLPASSSSTTTASAKDDQGWIGSSYHHQNDTSRSSSHPTDANSSSNNNGGGGVAAALLAHKSQQQQLMALQEQLQYHQRLLAQQDNEHPQPHQPQQQRYNSMSSSSASSSAHSSPQSSDLYQHPSRWSYDSHPNHHHSTKNPAATDMHLRVRMEVDNDEPLKVSV